MPASLFLCKPGRPLPSSSIQGPRLRIRVAKETVSNTKAKEELIVYRRLQVPVTNFTLLLMSVCCRQVIKRSLLCSFPSAYECMSIYRQV